MLLSRFPLLLCALVAGQSQQDGCAHFVSRLNAVDGSGGDVQSTAVLCVDDLGRTHSLRDAAGDQLRVHGLWAYFRPCAGHWMSYFRVTTPRGVTHNLYAK